MSLSGELESVGVPNAAADGLNEGDPREGSSSQGETNKTSAELAPKEPEKPKLWSEFSDDEDPIDTTLAREQLRKVCLASVGVRPCDVPTTSSQSLQRTKTTRYASSQPMYHSNSSHGSMQGRKGQNNRKSYNGMSHRGRRQDSLSVWQEAAVKSRPPAAVPNSAMPPAATKRRFGGLSFDALLSYKSDSKTDEKKDSENDVQKEDSTDEKHTMTTDLNLTAEETSGSDNSVDRSSQVIPVPDMIPEEGATKLQDVSESIPIISTELATDKSSPCDLKTSGCVMDTGKGGQESTQQFNKLRCSPRTSSSLDCNKSTMVSSISTCSSASVYVPGASRCIQMEPSSDDESDHDGLIEPRLREVEGDVIFDEKFDIWFTQPLSGARRGLAKEVYENGMHLIGTFNTLSQFFEFHGILEWDDLPPSSVIAFCRHGIKPIWEDPANERGGRYLVKNFKREETEAVFTKMALGFLSGMLHDWKHYNLISLHVRESRRGNDIQLWRSKLHSPKLTSQIVKADLQDFVENSQPHMTLSFVPNKESLSRNDSRLQQQCGHRRSKRGKHKSGNGGGGSSSIVTPYNGGTSHPVFQLYAQKGITKTFLAEEQKAAYARESEACLLTATPHKANVSLSLTSDDRLTSCGDDGGSSPVSSEDSVATISFKRSDIDSPKSDESLTSSRKDKSSKYSRDWRKCDDQDTDDVHNDQADQTSLPTREAKGGVDAPPYYPLPQSDYTAYVPPDVAMYYPHAPMSPASPNPYAQMYGYGYYMAQDQMMPASGMGAAYPSMAGPWYDNSPAQSYWAPNCAPPDTFCLTPYAYPYAYTTKGTTYFSMPTMQDAATGDCQAAEASTNDDSCAAGKLPPNGIRMMSADDDDTTKVQNGPIATHTELQVTSTTSVMM